MKIQLTKPEKIMALLNQWDPEGRYKDGEGLRSYSYEAETIAQEIRANSRVERIEAAIIEAFSDVELDKKEVHQMAVFIKESLK